jgi:hypothetical protein
MLQRYLSRLCRGNKCNLLAAIIVNIRRGGSRAQVAHTKIIAWLHQFHPGRILHTSKKPQQRRAFEIIRLSPALSNKHGTKERLFTAATNFVKSGRSETIHLH